MFQVSIIMATYNRASTVVRAIISIKSQSYPNIQLIVVDGASDDNTVSLVEPLLCHGDVLISEPDKGIYDALNKGLELATGEIIAFLHSDDLYSDVDVISKIVEQFCDKSIDAVYGDVSFFSIENDKKTTRIYRSDKLSKKNLAWGKMPAHPAMFIRRRVYDKVGGFKINFKIAADYEFLCRMVQYPNLKAIKLDGVWVRMQTGGVSTGGLSSTILLNKEVMRALRNNRISSNLFMILSKYQSKLLQFFRK